MKKAKIMLLATMICAVVGGILAFEAKRAGTTNYCYLTTEVQPEKGICTKCARDASANPLPNGPLVYFTPTTDCAKCDQAECPQVGRIGWGE
jgi:hypothetical protein